jgi:hypothetical protein
MTIQYRDTKLWPISRCIPMSLTLLMGSYFSREFPVPVPTFIFKKSQKPCLDSRIFYLFFDRTSSMVLEPVLHVSILSVLPKYILK